MNAQPPPHGSDFLASPKVAATLEEASKHLTRNRVPLRRPSPAAF